MTKIISVFLTGMLCLGLAGCSANLDPQQLNEKTNTSQMVMDSSSDLEQKSDANLVDSGGMPKYPTKFLSTYIQEETVVFYDVPDTIYTTPASENGLSDTFMYVEGEIESFDQIVENNIDYDILFLKTSKGRICIEESLKIEDSGISKKAEWDLLEAGKVYGIFFLYKGFSDHTQTAIGTFCNSKIEDGVSEDEIERLASEKNMAAGKEKLKELLTITKISPGKPNSAGGVTISIDWKNNSSKEIKYILFQVEAFNAVGDRVRCEIRDSSLFNLEETGPFKSGGTYTSKGKNAWYNKNIASANLDAVDIEYMDGTKESIQGHEVGYEWMQ